MESDQLLGSVEDQLYARACQTLIEMEYGKEVLADVEVIKKSIGS